jgi:hypothetical protein
MRELFLLDRKERVDGAIVSWGYEEPATFISRTSLQGTRDPAAYLAVPDAIRFVRDHDDRERCVALAREARRDLCALLGTEPLGPDEQILQMASVRLPRADPELSQRLFDEHRIEIPTMAGVSSCGSRWPLTRSAKTSTACWTHCLALSKEVWNTEHIRE